MCGSRAFEGETVSIRRAECVLSERSFVNSRYSEINASKDCTTKRLVQAAEIKLFDISIMSVVIGEVSHKFGGSSGIRLA